MNFQTNKTGDELDNVRLRGLFSRESLIRSNRQAFRDHSIQNVIEKRKLPVAHIAMSLYLRLLSEVKEDIRKDKKTPREQHEQSHIDALDHLLKEVGEDWIQEEQYGSVDALFAGTVLHDVIEDLKISPDMIQSYLDEGLRMLFHNGGLDSKEYTRAKKDIPHTIDIVLALSRKDENGKNIDNDDRIAQANNWLKHPYAYPIKQIDWSNKLQTMVGVEHFEKDNYAKMEKVLSETSLLFVDEQQAMTKQAVEKYPFLEEVCKPMDGVMGVLFQILNTYKKLKTGIFKFDPENAKPFDFTKYLDKSGSLLKRLFTGNNYISPLLERLDEVATHDPQTQSFLRYMVLPAFEDTPHITKHLELSCK